MIRMKKLFAVFVAVCFLAGCATIKEVPEDLSVAQLIQRGQDSFAAGNNKDAEKYFEAGIERFGNEPSVYVEIRYELAHLYEKTHRKPEARDIYNEILEIYEEASFGALPTAYKRLAQLGLERLDQ